MTKDQKDAFFDAIADDACEPSKGYAALSEAPGSAGLIEQAEASAAQRRGCVSREMWAVVMPSGEIVLGTDLKTEADAWHIALGWPGAAEIAHAKAQGAYAVRGEFLYRPPNTERQTTPAGDPRKQ